MSKEMLKSLVLGVLALVIGLFGVALQARRTSTRAAIAEQIDKPLLPDVTSADQVASLEIIEINEELASMRTFKIASR